ncbi:MAG: Uma2 family endonuclease [Jaaginema sp. PMC 1079.18]|nr:Uma2 family endonuclease [Jaaginema sp. PMC 1080.18]MEC4853054.1 Uma2 family endonuclease [Jaaginema sp. PMC 1079.18]MEC4866753.1 Uma2 family endonuclease [Jaaginema sp. PMC 1078.18]
MSQAIPKTPEILTETWQLMSWQDFQQLTNRPEYENARCYYDRGYMKIEMSPLGINHSRDNSVVARLVSLFATLKNIQVVEFTNVTLRKSQIQESQPDSTFYLGEITNFPTRSNQPIDLNQYSPPTLVIEISSTTLSDDLGQKRLLYERLGVREYWVINSNNAQVTAFEVIDGGSREIRVSQVLPTLQISVVEETLERSRTSNDGEVNRWLIQLFSQ